VLDLLVVGVKVQAVVFWYPVMDEKDQEARFDEGCAIG
jgi:hypothetical protein